MPYNLQHLLNLVHDSDPTFDADAVEAFVDRWKYASITTIQTNAAQAIFVIYSKGK